MKLGGRTVLLCSCERTMSFDADKIATALGADAPEQVHDHLCRTQIANFASALDADEPLLIACTQEAPLFEELATDAGKQQLLAFTNIRERAGWCTDKKDANPKIAALLAEAVLDVQPAGSITLKSEGVCLVYGKGQAALDVGRKLSERLSVTVLLSDAGDAIPPRTVDVPFYSGQISAASGGFGSFEIVVDSYAPSVPSSKGVLEFAMARDGAASQCELIFDMSGGDPLFPSHERRDGYFKVDPTHPAAVAEAMFAVSDMVGEFEKPIYVTYDSAICAHSRSTQIGCSRCLDVCPASAIASEGDIVSFDPVLCGGCGACASVCPSGAASYSYPRREDLIARAQVLVSTYRGAGGKDPVLLVHDESHGADMIDALARFGKGLPTNVIPFSVNEATEAGHEFMASALAAGASGVVFLCDPRKGDELTGLTAQAELVNTIMAALGHDDGERVRLTVEADPDALDAVLYDLPSQKMLAAHEFSAVGGKRAIARTALGLLNDAAPAQQEQVALPESAPYGRITIDTEGCTLCLACVSACPMNALQDNPDMPQVKFVEQACVQCGLCRTTCPESVITLEPRYDFTAQGLTPVTLNEEEPFECITCGKPFGTKSAIERVTEQLAGKHSMFEDDEAAQLIQMCDDCRIVHHTKREDNPFAAGERPKIRRTEDYIEAANRRRAGGKNGELSPDDFLLDDD